MVSGYFLAEKALHNRELYFSFLRKQLPRVFLPYVVWALFYSFFLYRSGEGTGTIFFRLLTFQSSTPLYFIALIIQFYILAPFAQRLANRKGLICTGVMSALFCLFIFYLRYYQSIDLPVILYAGTFIPYLFFFVLGIYFGKGGLLIEKRKISLGFAMLCLIIAVIDSSIEYNTFLNLKAATSTVKITSFLFAFAVMCFLFNPKNFGFKNFILSYLGVISFGIYFSHMYVFPKVTVFVKNHLHFFDSLSMQVIIALITIVVCSLLCFLARKLHKRYAVKYLGF